MLLLRQPALLSLRAFLAACLFCFTQANKDVLFCSVRLTGAKKYAYIIDDAVIDAVFNDDVFMRFELKTRFRNIYSLLQYRIYFQKSTCVGAY